MYAWTRLIIGQHVDGPYIEKLLRTYTVLVRTFFPCAGVGNSLLTFAQALYIHSFMWYSTRSHLNVCEVPDATSRHCRTDTPPDIKI